MRIKIARLTMPVLRNTSKKSPQRSRRRRSVRKARHRSSVNRKVLTVVFFVAVAAIVTLHNMRRNISRDDTCECNAAELHAAVESGSAAAARVSLTRPGSMERENAILSIRARESEIRRAGFPSAADSFAAAAERRLRADKVF